MVFISCARALCALFCTWQTAAICALLLRRGRRSKQHWGTGPRPGWEHLIWLLQPFFSILHAHLTAGVQGAGWWQCAHANSFWQYILPTGSATCSLAHAHPGPKSRAAQTGLILKILGGFLLGGGARVPALITRCWGSSSRTSRLDGSNCGRSTVSGMRLHQACLLLLFLRHLHLLLVACRAFGLFGQWLLRVFSWCSSCSWLSTAATGAREGTGQADRAGGDLNWWMAALRAHPSSLSRLCCRSQSRSRWTADCNGGSEEVLSTCVWQGSSQCCCSARTWWHLVSRPVARRARSSGQAVCVITGCLQQVQGAQNSSR